MKHSGAPLHPSPNPTEECRFTACEGCETNKTSTAVDGLKQKGESGSAKEHAKRERGQQGLGQFAHNDNKQKKTETCSPR
jgi:hypothetical protein